MFADDARTLTALALWVALVLLAAWVERVAIASPASTR
jgi:hypothetical protein